MNAPLPDTCPRCGSTDLIEVRCTVGPHHARVNCRLCGAEDRPSFVRWEAAPMTPERAAAWVMPFGKFAGSTLARIGVTAAGRSYLRWLLDEADLTPSARGAIECHLGTLEGQETRP